MRATRPVRYLTAIFVGLVLSLGLAVPAQASTPAVPAAVVAQAKAAVPMADQYATQFTLTINCQVVPRGVTCTLTITFGRAGERFTLVLFSDPVTLDPVVADANGVATRDFNTGVLQPGEHSAVATGDDGVQRTVHFTVTDNAATGGGAAAGGNAGGSTGTASSGGLAFTGSNAIIPLATIGAILVLAGGGAVVASRRRREV